MRISMPDEHYSIFMSRLPEAPIRDRCIMLFMLHGGLRNGEVCLLKWSDVSTGSGLYTSISVVNGHSVTKSRRQVSLSSHLYKSLQDYVAAYDQRYPSRDPMAPLFISKRRGIALQPRTLQLMVQHWSVKWLETAYTPHCLRHTFATRLMRCTNIRVVQQLLGHSSLLSTQIYTHPTADDRDRAINQAF